MLTIDMTRRAEEKVRVLLAGNDETSGYGLRIGVDPGGCAGYSYTLALAPEAEPDDIVVSHDGFQVFVNNTVAPLLSGVRIDYVESLTSSGFTFDNPNAMNSCGCGSSFAASDDAERNAADAALFNDVDDALQDIRPFLQGDGGDVTLVAVADGVVTVRLSGACGGCSLSAGTLSDVIERRLKEALPAITKVVQVA